MKKTIQTISVIGLLSLPLSAQKITLEGSTTVLPIAQKAAEVYMKKYPSSNITVKGGGSGIGISSLIEGLCDIANASRAVKEKELNNAAKKNRELKAHIIAMDGIVIIVHPSNQINDINKEALQKIFTGKIKNWKVLGGGDKKIIAVSRDSSSGTFEFFTEYVLDKKRTRADAIMQASNQGVLNFVANTEGAIGYIGHGYVNDKVKALKYEGIESTKDNILKNKYKLARPLYMYSLKNANPDVLKFIDFIKGQEGQAIVEETGFIPLK